MTKSTLFTPETMQAAKNEITPFMRDFLKVEPRNTLVIPETRRGLEIVNQAFAKLEEIGYSQEDSQLLMNEVVEALSNGTGIQPPAPSKSFNDDHF